MMFSFFSPLEQFDAIRVLPFSVKIFSVVYDISFLNIVLPLILAILFFYVILDLFLKTVKLIPFFWQHTLEVFFKLVFDILKSQVGYRGFIYFPFVICLFLFVLVCNLLSMIPFGIALTSHIIIIFSLSFTISLSFFVIGLLTHGLSFLKFFIPECPFFLLLLLIPIEIFSYVIRALSLAIRLSANIMAGHTLLFICASFVLKLSNFKMILALFFGCFLFLILALELGVAFLQAYVFTVLLCIYLNDSLKDLGH